MGRISVVNLRDDLPFGSKVLGELKDHPVAAVSPTGSNLAPGVIDLDSDPNDRVTVEVNGKRLANWLPWNFDHSKQLERWTVMEAPTGHRFCVVRVQRPGFPKNAKRWE